jgi:hypothetical protein
MISLEAFAAVPASAKNDSKPEPKPEPRRDTGEDDFAAWVADEAHGQLGEDGSSSAAADTLAADDRSTAALFSVERLGLSGVVYGWQLEAQKGLSQLHAAGHPEAMRPAGGAPGEQAEGGSQPAFAARVQGQASTPGNAQAQGRTQSLGFEPAASLAGNAGTAAGSSKLQQTAYAALASALTWSERYLRLLPNADGGGTTLWLRDYRLGPEQVAVAVEALIGQLADSGQITRIVINGVEAWRRNPSKSTEKA